MTLTEEQRGTMTFDLEAARSSISHYRIENPSNVDTESALKELVDQANLAEDALAEIERLRANVIAANHSELDLQLQIKELAGQVYHLIKELQVSENHLASCDLRNRSEEAILNRRIDGLVADLEQAERVIEARSEVIDQQAALTKSLKKEIRRLKHESKVEQEFTNSYIKRLHDAEARIKELESSLDEAETLTKQNAELMNAYLARIAELEDALAEERAGAIRCEFNDHCEIDLPDAMIRARQELQADGKIGPDAAKPQSWQITEERIGLLEYCLETLLDAPDIEEIPGPGHSIEMLRAMLREAEQCE